MAFGGLDGNKTETAHCVARHTFGSYNGSNVGWSREKVTTIVTIVNLLHNICSYCFHIGVWDRLGIVGSGSWCRAFPIQHIGDWPNSLDCTDLYQCGARRDAKLCCLCYIHWGLPTLACLKFDCISQPDLSKEACDENLAKIASELSFLEPI